MWEQGGVIDGPLKRVRLRPMMISEEGSWKGPEAEKTVTVAKMSTFTNRLTNFRDRQMTKGALQREKVS